MQRTYQILFVLSLIIYTSISYGQGTTQSIFSEGVITKLTIPQTGLYKISYEELKDNTAIDVDNINPNNIHIYGNRGGLLPLPNDVARADDLIENRIFLSGSTDNSFDPGDYILFYAEGGDRVNTETGAFAYEKNVYDYNNYYYIKVNDSRGLRIDQVASTPVASYRNYTERLIRHEEDRLNLLGQFGSTQGSGKQWFGETFTNNREQSFSESFRLNNPVANQEAQIKLRFAGRSSAAGTVRLFVNNDVFSSNTISVNLGNIEGNYASVANISQVVNLSESPEITVSYQNSGSNSEAWLDYIQMIVKEEISISNSPSIIYNAQDANEAMIGYEFPYSSNGLKIWDVSSLSDISAIEYNSSNGNVSFGVNNDFKTKTFVAFEESGTFLSPTFSETVPNQNLHGIERADLIIVYHPNFKASAEKLADHRRTQDNLIVETIEIQQVYNEFAGGKQDPVAMRDFFRLIHLRDNNFKYVVLLGDASYDYKGLVVNLPNQNFVPTYETDESLNGVDAYPSDDFFALLSEDEGGDRLSGDIDIGIGRIPAKDADEAMGVVEKIISYDTNPNRFGDWRTVLGFSADDVDASWDTVHLRDSDNIARQTEESHPCLLQKKVYFDSYKQEATPGGSRYPDANKAINDNIFKGQLVYNYLGHGGPKGLSQERVLQIADIRSWTNMDKLPIFITATCSFTGFDEPNFVSAGEHLILNPNGGAVALFTTVRSVYASQNFDLTEGIFKEIFLRTEGLPSRLGDIIVKSKNSGRSSARENTRKFLLMGDPCMRIALPQHKAEITEYNNVQIQGGQQDTLGALGRATFGGRITSHKDGTLVSDFNGEVDITIFDKPSTLYTLTNDNNGSPIPFDVKKNVLYRGSATVTNGTFSVDVILPMDINYEFGKGYIHLYALSNNEVDAAGCYQDLVIGGTSSSVIEDNEGPEVNIFFNDRTFEFGGSTTKEPLLLVDLADENGINLSSTSIGHDITAVLEDQNGDKIVLNDFYEPTPNKVGEGTVSYQMPKLEPGPHKIYIKAWDILNNSTEEVMEFVVQECEDGAITNIYNYPNPFSTYTEFAFNHDLVNTELDIVINIYTVSGKLVKSITDNRFSSGTLISDLSWDARDDYGNKLAKGIYLYKINLYSSQLNLRRESDFSKLVILN